MPREYRPMMRVRVTLSKHWQNTMLVFMHSHLGISESFEEDHTIYMTAEVFAGMMCAMSKAGVCPTLVQLKADFIDMKKEPQITVVRLPMNYSKIDKGDIE